MFTILQRASVLISEAQLVLSQEVISYGGSCDVVEGELLFPERSRVAVKRLRCKPEERDAWTRVRCQPNLPAPTIDPYQYPAVRARGANMEPPNSSARPTVSRCLSDGYRNLFGITVCRAWIAANVPHQIPQLRSSPIRAYCHSRQTNRADCHLLRYTKRHLPSNTYISKRSFMVTSKPTMPSFRLGTLSSSATSASLDLGS